MTPLVESLKACTQLFVKQRLELAEFVGIETRNKYAIVLPDGQEIGYAAEQQKGVLGFLLRQALGHWRTFEILVFDAGRRVTLRAVHPFRFFFQRLEVSAGDGRPLGAIQQRFSIFTKRFDVEDASGRVVMQVSSPFWRLWTFPFERGGRRVAVIEKKWTGLLAEAFTDRDSFRVAYEDPALTSDERQLVLAASIFVDLQYFERKAE